MIRLSTFIILISYFTTVHAQFATCYELWDYFEEIYTITTCGEHIYVGTDKTIHRYNGQNWAVMDGVNVNLPYSEPYKAILADGPNIYTGNYDGVYRSVNGGATFELKNNGMGRLQVYSLLKVGNAIYAGVSRISGITYHDQRILLTTDNCETWVDISGDLPFAVLAVYSIAWDGTWLYAATGVGVFRTRNNGKNWIAINDGIPEWFVYKLLAVNNSVVFAGTGDGLYRWTNSDGKWTKLTNGLPEGTVVGLIGVDSKIIVSIALSSIYVSPDLGANWFNIGHGLHDAGVRSDIAANDQSLFALTLPNRHLLIPGKVHRRLLDDALNVPMPDTGDIPFSIFENPVQNYITIYNHTGEDATVYFYSLSGQMLLQHNLKAGVNTIETRRLPSGVLLTRCVGGESVVTARILKL